MALTARLPDRSSHPLARSVAEWLRRLGGILRERAPAAVIGTLAYLVARPVLALLHELIILLAATLLDRLGTSGATAALSGAVPLDPVYTSTMFLLLANIQVVGVAVARPLGEPLHAVWPGLFAAPELLADGAWASAVIQPGASVIARGLAVLSAEVAFLVLGLVLVMIGLGGRGRPGARPRWLAVFGTLLQAHVAVDHLAAQPVSLGELEATGLTFGFSILFTGPPSERPRLSTVLLALPEPVRDAILVAAAVLLTYALALVCVLVPLFLLRLTRRLRAAWCRRAIVGPERRRPGASPMLVRAGLAAFALIVAASPLDSLADAESHYLEPEAETAPVGSTSDAALLRSEAGPQVPYPHLQGPVAADTPTATAEPSVGPGPTSARQDPVVPPRVRVELVGSNYHYTYLVNGRPQVLRGMGYNPVYGKLLPDERAARYDRDFAAMRAAGVNTLVGWDTHAFDELLLDKAHQHGLGVVVPYDLPWSLDYTDPAIRDALMRDVLDRVGRFKHHPAVRMWGPGNEVLHKLVFPSWLHLRGDPLYEARADAFAAFYVELIDRVHELDPDHPVTYRDAEDGYVLRLKDALLRDGVRRPWFVYGINIYTTRLAEVIASWPSLGLDNAVFVSEFGPGGAGPADRPHGYRELWEIIRAQPRYVLGGAPYVWTTDGPEEADRIFGLVDASAQPVDGAFAMLGRLYRGEAAVEPSPASAVGPRVCSERVGAVARTTIADLQASPYTIQFQARTPPIVIGQLDNLPPDSLRPEDFRFERSGDPARLAYQRDRGSGEEWWVTWSPPSHPGDQVAMLIREGSELTELAYIYHGPASPSATSWTC